MLVIRYDVREKQWHNVPSMNSRRSKHGMVEVDGNIYVVGGFDGTSTVNTMESYNVQTNRSVVLLWCSVRRTVHKGKLEKYLILHVFIRWKTRAAMPTRRRCVCAVAYKKFIYIIGGHDGSSILNTIEKYDTSR